MTVVELAPLFCDLFFKISVVGQGPVVELLEFVAALADFVAAALGCVLVDSSVVGDDNAVVLVCLLLGDEVTTNFPGDDRGKFVVASLLRNRHARTTAL